MCAVRHIGTAVASGPYRCCVCRDTVGMLECVSSSCVNVPTAVKDSEAPKGEVLGVVAFLRSCAQHELDAELAAEAASVLQAAGRAVKAPVRGTMFQSSDAPEDDEYLSLENAIADMWHSPMVTDLRQISEYIGPDTPDSLASPTSPTAVTERAESPSVQLARSRRLRPPASGF